MRGACAAECLSAASFETIPATQGLVTQAQRMQAYLLANDCDCQRLVWHGAEPRVSKQLRAFLSVSHVGHIVLAASAAAATEGKCQGYHRFENTTRKWF